MNYKHRLFKRYKLGFVLFSTYKEINNSVSRSIKRAKRHYFTRKLNESRNDMKQTWRTMNYNVNRNKSKSDCITLVDVDGGDVCDLDRISNMFCDYFSSVATNLNNDIPTSNSDLI